MSPILGSLGNVAQGSYRGNLDDYPNQFILGNLSNIEPGSVGVATTSITGVNYKARVVVSSGASVSTDGVNYFSQTTIRNNETLYVRFVTTSGSEDDFNKVYNTNVQVGRVVSPWSVRTREKDTTPTGFAFVNSTQQNVGIATSSNAITLSGLETGFSVYSYISSGTGTLSINGSPGVSTAMVSNGNVIRIVDTSSNNYSTTKTTSIVVGSYTTSFSVTTRESDTLVNSFSFSDLENVNLNQDQISNTITLSGADSNIALASTITGSSGQISVNSGPFITGTTNLFNGNSIRVRIPASVINQFSTKYTTTLNIAGFSTTFSVTTRPEIIKTIPNQFFFSDQTSVTPNSIIDSNTITLSGMTPGFTGTATISGGSGQFRVIRNGSIIRNFSSDSFSVQNNDQITLRLVSGGQLTSTQTTFSVSGTDSTFSISGVSGFISDIWNITSRGLSCVVTSLNQIQDIIGISTNSLRSRSFTISGLDSNCDTIMSTSNISSYLVNNTTGIQASSGLQVRNGDSVSIFMTSPEQFGTARSTTITASRPSGADLVTKTWTIITQSLDTIPDPFGLSNRSVVNVPLNSEQTTFVTTSLSGLSPGVSVPASVTLIVTSGNSTALLSKNGGPFVSSIVGGVTNGDRIDLKVVAPSSPASDVVASVNIGGRVESWRVTTGTPTPILNFTAFYPSGNFSPTSSTSPLPYGQSVQLNWTSSYAVSISGGNTFPAGTSFLTNPFSPLVVTPLTTTTYTLTAVGPGGNVSRSITVFVGPPPATVNLSASSQNIPYNGSVTLTWSSVGARSLVSSNFGATTTSGTRTISNLKSTTTYQITILGEDGKNISSTPVTVNVPACTPQTSSDIYGNYKTGQVIYVNGSRSLLLPYFVNSTNTSPIGSTTYKQLAEFINQVYLDNLGRPVDRDKLSYWINRRYSTQKPVSVTFSVYQNGTFLSDANGVSRAYLEFVPQSGAGAIPRVRLFGHGQNGKVINQTFTLYTNTQYALVPHVNFSATEPYWGNQSLTKEFLRTFYPGGSRYNPATPNGFNFDFASNLFFTTSGTQVYFDHTQTAPDQDDYVVHARSGSAGRFYRDFTITSGAYYLSWIYEDPTNFDLLRQDIINDIQGEIRIRNASGGNQSVIDTCERSW